MPLRYAPLLILISLLAGCGPNYSPNTYAANAAQQANKADQGTIVGVRQVEISAAGTVGTVTGAAAGGIAGSQAAPAPLSAFTALGGSLLGGLAGSATEHAINDTTAFEYIVKKQNGDLVSVTQKDTVPLALGQKVLVIAGNQARVVPDYTVQIASSPGDKPAPNAAASAHPATEATTHPADAAAPPVQTPPEPAAAGHPADDATPASGPVQAAGSAAPAATSHPADSATAPISLAPPPAANPVQSSTAQPGNGAAASTAAPATTQPAAGSTGPAGATASSASPIKATGTP